MSYAYGMKGPARIVNQFDRLPYKDMTNVAAASDPYFSNVILLLNGTTLTDNSSANRSVVLNGSPQLSSTQSKFGTQSIYFASGTDYLTIPSMPALGSAPYTIEMFVYLVAFNGGYGENAQLSGTTTGDTIMMVHNNSGRVDLGVESASWNVQSNTTTAQLGVWKHIAVVRNAGVTTIFANGVNVGSGSWSPNFSGGGLKINRRNDSSGGTWYLNGLRITSGVARYTADFAPPTEPFPNQ